MLSQARILIVDDEPRLCESLKLLLERQSYEVDSVSRGEDALNAIERAHFDIALVDLMLPDMRGHRLIDHFTARSPSTCIILMTGNASLDTAVLALRKGAYDYLRKPFEFDELLKTIQNALQQKELKDENRVINHALELSQQQYEYLVQNSPDIIYTLDHTGRFTFISNSAEHLIGMKSEEIVGKHYTQIIHDEDQDRAQWSFNERRTGKRATSGFEIRLRVDKPDHQNTAASCKNADDHIIVELKATGMYDGAMISDSKKFLGTHGVARDISKRKKAEQAKQLLETRLQRANKMEAIGTLAGGVAHDLNNILSGIVSYPELLLMQVEGDSPLRKPILTMQETGKRAAAIVQDLLTLSRRGVTSTEVMNINKILSEYLHSHEFNRLKSYHPSVSVETNLEEDLLNICGSPIHISKTIMNLVSNAAEAMPEGGKISIRTANRYADCAIKGYEDVREGEYVVLDVSDTGIGISREDQEQIFEPFYTKKVMGRSGTGLGMTVVWGTIKDHNGYIDISSTVGKGTRFTLYFPVTRKEAVKNPTRPAIEDYRGKGEAVLVVDDVREQREIASAMLEQLGYCVNSVPSGEAAVEFVSGDNVDLLVLDMIMDPGIDGLETYRRILEKNPNQKAVIASGFSQSKLVKEAQKLGAGEYVKKPYTMEKIGMALRRAMAGNNGGTSFPN
ncbi:MAG: response regulator [Desulfobacteraceae bacterium]|nr:response regulator [Desulfobacteraceae bacterium]